MLSLQGYRITKKLYESEDTLAYQAVRLLDSQTVVLKVLKKDFPLPTELKRFRHEYDVLRHLDIEQVIKVHDLIEYQNTLILVLEDFQGESLENRIRQKTFSTDEFLPLAIKIIDAFSKIHENNIIHKDINPSNIVFNSQTGELKLIDFGISSRLSHENPEIKNPNILEGTLPYMSPEQTGRMNRFLDYRTDFYSLGATFYAMVCGRPPFKSTNPLEIIYSHIAKVPTAPHIRNRKVNRVISDIIMKLLSKDASERYQSFGALRSDLEQCLWQFNGFGKIEPFTLASNDYSSQFQIPPKLYGRDNELETLKNAFERVASGQAEILFLTGSAGVGKTSLVKEVFKPLTLKRGNFISGKFDQLKRDIPYRGFLLAFRELLHQLLAESDLVLEQRRDKLIEALGLNGQLIVNVIPEVEMIIGPQPALPKLGPSEEQNRFTLAFQKFIRTFCDPEHPLVLFLDDLQWADSASLNLIEKIITDEHSQDLFIIGAYRDSEVNPGHPLLGAITQIAGEGVEILRLNLEPLQLSHIKSLLSDSLHQPPKRVASFADLVLQKTEGNPFFISIFLNSLHARSLIMFNHHTGAWQWNHPMIQNLSVTENLGELLSGKIKRLQNDTQKILQLAACIGNRFNLDMIQKISDTTELEILTAIREAVEEGLIVPLDNGKASKNEKHPLPELSQEYRFAHDRIQLTTYSIMKSSKRQDLHYKIGKLLLKHVQNDALEEHIFDIVNHLNRGIFLESNKSDIEELAKLNLIAGNKAKASAAHEPAYNYLNTTIKLMDKDGWSWAYELMINLHIEAAEAAYLCGKFDRMEQLCGEVLERAEDPLHKARIFQVKIEAFKAQYKLTEALNTAKPILKLLGINFPQSPKRWQIVMGMLNTKRLLLGKPIESLTDLPKMTDPVKLEAMRIMTSVGSAAYFTAPDLFPLIVFKVISYSLRFGNAKESAFLYATYGLFLCGVLNDIPAGYRFGQVALKVLDTLEAAEYKTRTNHLVYGMIFHWKDHIRTTLDPLKDAFKNGLESGDFEYAGFCALFSSYHSFLAGEPLENVAEETAECSTIVKRFKHETSQYMIGIYQQAVANLMGDSEKPAQLVGDYYDETQMASLHENAEDRTTLYTLYFNKMILGFLFGDFEQAAKDSKKAKQYIEGVVGMFVVPVFHFYDSLIQLSGFSDETMADQKKILKKVFANQKKLKHWATQAPENHMNKYCLVQAEWMAAVGEDNQAQELYDEAIASAKKNQFIQETAMAQELAAKYYLRKHKRNIAKAYLQEARYSYMKWGAAAKMEVIDKEYAKLLGGASFGEINVRNLNLDHIQTVSKYSSSERLDLSSVVKASQAISSEIVLSKLLSQLMKIVVENAGARKGLLILENEGKFYIEAEGSLAMKNVTLHESVPVDTCENLSSAIVHYVARTRESIVLNDALREGLFTNDPYLISVDAKSVLCAPIIQKSRLLGMFYLENNLMSGAFTTQRLEVLKLLSSQIAISLENARLYSTLEDSELRYRELYENMVDMVVLVSQEDVITMANPRFYTTVGVTYQKGLEIGFKKWVHPEDLANVEENLLTKLHEHKIVQNFQFRLLSKTSNEFEVECNAKCIDKEDGTVGYQMVIRDVTERKRLEKELMNTLNDVQNARAGTILGLAKLAEYRDEDTGVHLERIREYAKIIAEELAQHPKYKSYITPDYIGDLYFSSILHDIGKVGIPDSILLKPSRLTEEEFEIIKQHTLIGGDILRQVNSKVEGQSFLNVGMHIAYYHHEKWNGKGYPKGLKKEEIPLSARIVALVDVYDALTSKRIYKDAFSHEKAKGIILEERGEHFDPDIVDAFSVHEAEFDRIREKMHMADEDKILMQKLQYRTA